MKWIINNLYLVLFVLLIPTLLGFTYNSVTETSRKLLTPVTVKKPNEIKPIPLEEITKKVTNTIPRIGVTITMYEPVENQTDKTPNITADGTKFKIENASRYKYVALSRNLLTRWGGEFNYGDSIRITGTEGKNGEYQVRDTMNPRFKNYVDILESPGTGIYKHENAVIEKIEPGSKAQ